MDKLLRSAIAQIIIFATASTAALGQVTTNLYYDANGTTNGIGGTGNWTTTGANWTTNPLGTSALVSGGWTNSAAWSNSLANNAILQGTAGTVSLSSTVFANQIQVNTTGFTIQNTSTTAAGGGNRYFRTKNGIVLADGVNLNVSAGVATNGSLTGFEGLITGTNGTTGVNTNCSLTIVGATANADSSVRIGLDTAATDIRVPVYVNTTGGGYALIGISSSSVTSSIYGNIIVSNNSRLVLGNNNSSTSRRINARGNLTTVNTDLVIGEAGSGGMVVLYGSNSIGGNVVLQSGSLGYAANTAFGSSTVVISNGTSFGQQGTIGANDQDRTLSNNISLQGSVTLGLGSFGNFLSGNIDLNNATRTITSANSTTFSGSVTNGSIVLSNSSPTRTNIFSGSVNLSSFTNLSLGNTTFNGNTSITNLVLSNGVTFLGGGTNSIASCTVNQGSLNAANLAGTSLTLAGSATTANFSNTATSGSLSVGSIALNGLSSFTMDTAQSMSVSCGSLTFSGASNSVVLTNSVLSSGATYTLFTASSVNTNGLTEPLALKGSGVNNASGLVLGGAAVTSGSNIYTFRVNGNTLELQVDPNLAVDLTWNGGSSGNWNTNASNLSWNFEGNAVAFSAGNNAIVDTAAGDTTLAVAAAGIDAGYVAVSGGSNATFTGGTLTALGLTVNGGNFTANNSINTTNLTVTNANIGGSGAISVSAGTSVQSDAGSNSVVSAAISGTGSLTVSGSGTVTLAGGNNYSGETLVNGGTLTTGGNEKIPNASPLRLAAGGTFQLGGNETVASLVAATGSFVNLSDYSLTVGGTGLNFTNTATVSGNGSLVKNGAGLIYLNNSGGTYAGGFTLNAGEVAFTASGASDASGVLNSVFGTGTLRINGGIVRSSSDTSGRNIFNDIAIDGDVQFGAVGAAATVTLNSNALKTSTLLRDVTVTTIAPVEWEQQILGAGRKLTKNGTNTMSLRGANFLNTIFVAQGDLYARGGSNTVSSVIVATGGRLGYGSTAVTSPGSYFGSATIVLSNGAALGQFGTNGTGTDAERLLPNAISIQGDVAFGLGSFSSYFAGNLNLNNASRTIAVTNSTYLLGSVTNGSLVVTNTSATRTVYLNASNAVTGVTQNGGVISLGNDQALGGGSLTVNATTSASTLTVSANRTIGNAIVLAGNVALTANTAALTNTPFVWTQNGAISGSGSLTKSGEGTLILAAANTHVGSNALSAGTLVLGNAAGLGSSNNPLNLGGGVLALNQNSGDILAGNTTVSANSILDLGNGTPSRTIRIATLTFPATNIVLTVSNTANGSVYLPTSLDTNSLVQIKSAETTNAASINPTNGLLSFTGGVPPPNNLSYSPASQTGTVGTAITNMSPTVTGTVDSYSVDQALPAGLSINLTNGVISGTPAAVAASKSYIVTASNAGGSNSTSVTIEVGKGTPTIDTAPTASNITQGQSLASSTLSGGSASVAGTFAWTDSSYVPPSPGIYGRGVTFTPTDSANYNAAATTVNVTVISVYQAGYNTWISSYSLTGDAALGTADPDKDGFINSTEYAFGTNPTVPNGSLLSTATTVGNLQVSWNGPAAGVSYAVQTTTNLSTSPFQVPTPEIGISTNIPGIMSFSNPATGIKFFRVRATSN